MSTDSASTYLFANGLVENNVQASSSICIRNNSLTPGHTQHLPAPVH